MVNSLKNKKILNCTISTYLTVSLLNKLENIIISNKVAGNYYTSVSDLLRNALVAHKNGMTLTAHDIKDLSTKNKHPYSLRVPQELYDFYLTFPQNVKSEIFERAVRTYIWTGCR